MNYKEELEKLEKQINENKLEKARTEERLKQAQKEYEEIVKELESLNLTPDDLQNKIAELEINLEEGINKCKELLS